MDGGDFYFGNLGKGDTFLFKVTGCEIEVIVVDCRFHVCGRFPRGPDALVRLPMEI